MPLAHRDTVQTITWTLQRPPATATTCYLPATCYFGACPATAAVWSYCAGGTASNAESEVGGGPLACPPSKSTSFACAASKRFWPMGTCTTFSEPSFSSLYVTEMLQQPRRGQPSVCEAVNSQARVWQKSLTAHWVVHSACKGGGDERLNASTTSPN